MTVLNKATSVDANNPDVFLKLGTAQNSGTTEAAVLAWQKYLRVGSQWGDGRRGEGADRQAQPRPPRPRRLDHHHDGRVDHDHRPPRYDHHG